MSTEIGPRDYCICCGAGPGQPCDKICREIQQEIYLLHQESLSIAEQADDKEFATRQAEIMQEIEESEN